MFGPSGGLAYQFRAAMNSRIWRPYRQFVGAWLLEWLSILGGKKSQQLVLVGPNAGYSLDPLFLDAYNNLIVIEPDPMAYVLFEMRFLKRAHWVRHDYFQVTSARPNAIELKLMFENFQNSDFLFCNVLGQLPLLLKRESSWVEEYMRGLSAVFASVRSTHNVASYHDLYSKHKRRPNEIVDHMTNHIFDFVEDKKEFPWALTSRSEHQIEFVRWRKK